MCLISIVLITKLTNQEVVTNVFYFERQNVVLAIKHVIECKTWAQKTSKGNSRDASLLAANIHGAELCFQNARVSMCP